MFFARFARYTAHVTGHPVVFTGAVLVLICWAACGPFFSFSDTWQLVVNTGTTIITFLMVFLIQNTQNRDNEAAQLKLDELIRALQGARNTFLDLEELTDKELDEIRRDYLALAEMARNERKRRGQIENLPGDHANEQHSSADPGSECA